MARPSYLFYVFTIAVLLIQIFPNVCSRKHHLVLSGDQRKLFPVSTFGYFPGGSLNVTVVDFRFRSSAFNEDEVSNKVGFTLMETTNNNYSPYLEGEHVCLLDNTFESFKKIGIVLMRFNFNENRVYLECNPKLSDLRFENSIHRFKREDALEYSAIEKDATPVIQDSAKHVKKDRILTEAPVLQHNEVAQPEALRVQPQLPEQKESSRHSSTCERDSFVMNRTTIGDEISFSFAFQMHLIHEGQQGLYQLYFHNCLNYPVQLDKSGKFNWIDLDLYLEEKNIDSYLSAGEMPLPQIYFNLSVVFFLLGIVWFYSLHSTQSETFRIHYLMGLLVFVKSFALLFHGINFYFIARDGTQVETWAILYYITHFLKGALMFFTIVLIGTGWAFVKHILSDKDKKIFMIVIPLQVIANIADIITEESEEGALIHMVWREIFILVDLVCCGAILFPVIWSIHHLQEASQTDGKAASNLKKLQLFRHFYVMIVVYIYFTRIIVYLVKITVPFNYQWLEQLFQHLATLIFFVVTGYRFQPTGSNPYHQLLQEEIELDEEVLFIQPSTFTEAKRRHRDLESRDSHQILLGRSFEFD